jgi:hypothetical protein
MGKSLARDESADLMALTAERDALQVRLDAAEQELAHWKICSQCGEAMEAPGYCSNGESEVVLGLRLMHDEILDRAEAAEALCQTQAQTIARLETTLREAMDGLLGIVGLVQLVGHRDDLPEDLNLFASHRYVEALAASKKAEAALAAALPIYRSQPSFCWAVGKLFGRGSLRFGKNASAPDSWIS